MSYILDALKKSEQKRRRGSVPDIAALNEAPPQKAGKKRLWLYLIAAALLLNAGIFIWLMKPWEPDKALTVAENSAMIENGNASVKSSAQPRNMLLPPKNEAQGKIATPSLAAPSMQEKSLSADTPVRELSLSGSMKNASVQGTQGVGDLPLSVQQSIPEIIISAHFYDSEPSSRIVSINGRVMREGQALSGGVKIERITKDGVIFVYQGYRFFKGIF